MKPLIKIACFGFAMILSLSACSNTPEASAKAPKVDVAAAKLTVAPTDSLAKFATEQAEIAPVVDYLSEMHVNNQNLPDKQVDADFYATEQVATYVESTNLWGGRTLDTYQLENGEKIAFEHGKDQILFRLMPTGTTNDNTVLSDEDLQAKGLAYAKEMIPDLTYDQVEFKKFQLSCVVRFHKHYSGADSVQSVTVTLNYNGALRSIDAVNYGCMDGLADAEFDKAALDKRLDAHMKERFSDCGMSYEVTDSYFTPDAQNERLLYYYMLTVSTWQEDQPDSRMSAPYEVYFDVGAIADFKAQ